MFCVYDANTSVFILRTFFWSTAAFYCRKKLENLLRTDRQTDRQTNKQTNREFKNRDHSYPLWIVGGSGPILKNNLSYPFTKIRLDLAEILSIWTILVCLFVCLFVLLFLLYLNHLGIHKGRFPESFIKIGLGLAEILYILKFVYLFVYLFIFLFCFFWFISRYPQEDFLKVL